MHNVTTHFLVDPLGALGGEPLADGAHAGGSLVDGALEGGSLAGEGETFSKCDNHLLRELGNHNMI